MEFVIWLKRNLQFVVATLALVVVSVILTWYLATRQTIPTQTELTSLKTEVGKLMQLPTDEEPTLAKVSDKTQLKDPFLIANAENGDQILIYAKNKLAVIYRPKTKRIVIAGTATIDPALAEAIGVALTVMDGTNNPEKTEMIIDKVKTAYPGIEVTNGGKTSRQDFPTTIVIDNTNEKDNLVDALAIAISGKRGVLPLGVSRMTTDFMIIVGADNQ